MSPHLLGGIVVAIWMSPAFYLAALLFRDMRDRGHRPDPVFTEEDWDQIDALLREAA